MDYEPLDLSPFCNAGREAYVRDPNYPEELWHYRPDVPPPIGRQTFHGLPFQIGTVEPGNAPCYIALGHDQGLRSSPLVVPVANRARYLIFAHALLETQLWQGGPVGLEVAHYRFHFDGEDFVTVPIRERFEVGNIPLPWGHYPFLCLADQKDSLMDRYAGNWQDVGMRKTEAQQGWPLAYYLWVWQNPFPERPLQSIEFLPSERRLIVAAVTLGHLDEWPLVRRARRPIKITLTDAEVGDDPIELMVEVDRGVATYPYPLPQDSFETLAPDMSGWGAPLNTSNNPVYTEVAATSSATVTVKTAEKVLGEVVWGELEKAGTIIGENLRVEIVDPGRNWVHVTVVDEDTGEPIPCRVAFHSSEGVPYAPHGHHAPLFSNLWTWNLDVGADIRLGQISYAYIDGKCQGWLPRGKVLVDVARGYEYEPLRQWVDIEPGQQHLKLKLKRWVDMNAQRYFSGDSHVHFLSAQGSQTEAAGEDLNVVNLLQSQWGHHFSNKEDFSGRPFISPDGRTIVYVSQENRQHMLGHLTLLGLKEPVMPWCSGGPGEAELGGSLDITLSHWADACHAQGGTVIIPHLPAPNAEPAVLIATNRADAVEILEHRTYEHLEYYRYLNGGYRLPLVGGTDKMSANTPVGLYRTYVYISPEEAFTYENWCKGLRAGRTFASGGALLWFTVDGRPLGDTLNVKGGGTVEIEAIARSIFPLHSLQIVQQGRVVMETSSVEGSRELILRGILKINSDTWLAARCAGPNYTAVPHFDQRKRGIFAHTSPVYITTVGEYDLFDQDTSQYMLTLVEGGLSYVRHTSTQNRPGEITYHHGLDDHLAYLEGPFHEAQEALHRRLHRAGIPH